MLIKLMQADVGNHWPQMLGGLRSTLPPMAEDTERNLNNILQSLLEGRADAWMATQDDLVYGYAVTNIIYDGLSLNVMLQIYAAFSILPPAQLVPDKVWDDSIETLTKYATELKCNRVVAFSNVPRMLEIAERVGGSLQYTFVSFDLR